MNYKDLEIWKRGIALTRQTYAITKLLPDTEKYGLVTQMQRSASSVPSNIAEGSGRNSTKEYIRFINIATGSLYELETHLILVEELGYADTDSILKNEVLPLRKMLYRFRQSLENSNKN